MVNSLGDGRALMLLRSCVLRHRKDEARARAFLGANGAEHIG